MRAKWERVLDVESSLPLVGVGSQDNVGSLHVVYTKLSTVYK